MYGILDNLRVLPMGWDAESTLPAEVFATSFNEPDEGAEIRELTNVGAYVYSKDFVCPVCKAKFASAVIRQSKLKLSHMDGLRPIYKDIEPLCYGILLCVSCGYAALEDKFDSVSEKQRDSVIQNVRLNYSNFMPAANPEEIDLKLAVERYKYALLSAVAKRATNGEHAMLLLKISWLYEALCDTENRMLFARYAYDFLQKAYSSERFPIMGLSQAAATYLLAAFAKDFKEYDVSLKLLAGIITDRSLGTRLRELARDLKDQIIAIKKAAGEEDAEE